MAQRSAANLTEAQAERVRDTLGQYANVFSMGKLSGATQLDCSALFVLLLAKYWSRVTKTKMDDRKPYEGNQEKRRNIRKIQEEEEEVQGELCLVLLGQEQDPEGSPGSQAHI